MASSMRLAPLRLDASAPARARNKKLDQEMKKQPKLYPTLHPSYMTGLCKGFRIIEAGKTYALCAQIGC